MIISKNVKNALIEQNMKNSLIINNIISDINTDSGVSKLEVFHLGLELGILYSFELETSTYGIENEIKEAIEKLKEYLLNY